MDVPITPENVRALILDKINDLYNLEANEDARFWSNAIDALEKDFNNRILHIKREIRTTINNALNDEPIIQTEQAHIKTREKLAEMIHYPACWDIGAYPSLEDALIEMTGPFECTTCHEIAGPKEED